jgi:uncharacterized membrane protein YhaH (DUF805 family)
MSLTQLLFSFQGRLNRKPFLITNIAIGVITTPLILLALGMAGELAPVMAGEPPSTLFNLACAIPTILFGLAIGAKRLHDRDKSAWWLVVLYAIPQILSTASNWMEGVGFFILSLINMAIIVWAFVELVCLRGTPGPNRYGPDPLGVPA